MKKLVSLLVVIGMLALSAAAFAEGTTLNVSGEGVVFLESDMAIITLGVRETNTDVLVAQTTVNEKIASVRKALLEAGMAESDFNTRAISESITIIRIRWRRLRAILRIIPSRSEPRIWKTSAR